MSENTGEQSNVFEVKIDQSVPKDDYYSKELQGINPEAFFVLGGGNREVRDSKGKISYRTSPYKGKFFPEKMGGAKARPIAMVELAKFYPDAKIVTMSHRPNYLFQLAEQTAQSKAMPPFSQVLAEEIERWGVEGQRIIQESESTSTLTEMMEIIKISAVNDWRNVAVVTNGYQIERALEVLDILKDDNQRTVLKNQLQYMFKIGEETDLFNTTWNELEQALVKFKKNNTGVVFVSAENVLRRRGVLYERLINELVETDGYKNVMEQERLGNEKIKSGTYNFAQDTFKEYIMAAGQKTA
jgi:uncharacterized SAM-binding protein YcdF (DUF218 family)